MDNESVDNPVKDACGFALELVKQFLTLAAAGIAFVVGLVYADKPGKLPPGSVQLSLILLGLSLLFGWLAFMAIVGKVNKRKSYDVYEPAIQFFSVLQILLFGIGVVILFFPTIRAARTQQTAAITQMPTSATKSRP